MTSPARSRPIRSLAGNIALLAVLCGCALWLLGLQPRPWFTLPDHTLPDQPLRWQWAAAAIAAYVGLLAWSVVSARRSYPSNRIESDDRSARILVAYASQTGFALQVATQTAQALRSAGHNVMLRDLGTVDASTLATLQAALFVASTTGEGDPPDHVLGFVREVMSHPAPAQLQFGVLALGDRSYSNFVAFGRRLDGWLRRGDTRALFDRIDVDNGDHGALRHWQHHLGVFAGAPELPDWAPAAYEPWTLCERRLLNPASPGGPVYHLALAPPPGRALDWIAGDIAEIGPRNAPDAVRALLAASGQAASSMVEADGTRQTLAQRLARSHLPAAAAIAGLAADGIARQLQTLPHREYSIAAIPADGQVHLLVRRMLRNDGTPGLGSAWLCDHATVGATIDLRIRSNPNFHPPRDARPLIAIGNGTGIAGLRAVLKARIAGGHRRNWLLFGERARAHDFHYGQEFLAWERDGAIERLDLAFSRDARATEPRYVQHLLRARAPALGAWLREGASVHVCGSLAGMAPAVEAELLALVGRDGLDRMAAEGRYRRDVY